MWCIVPFKVLTQGKQRLAGVLPEPERTGLCRAMIGDLLLALKQVQLLEGILMVSDDPGAALLAEEYGLDLIGEDRSRGSGLNNALNRAIDRLTSASVNDVMIIHSDLPLATPADLTSLIQQHTGCGERLLTAVPDRWRQGTNCLIASSCSPVPVRFGADSLALHRRAAAQQDIPFRTAEVPSIMFDIDTPADLRELTRYLDTVEGSVAVNTRSFLDTIDGELFRKPSPATVDRHYSAPEHEALL